MRLDTQSIFALLLRRHIYMLFYLRTFTNLTSSGKNNNQSTYQLCRKLRICLQLALNKSVVPLHLHISDNKQTKTRGKLCVGPLWERGTFTAQENNGMKELAKNVANPDHRPIYPLSCQPSPFIVITFTSRHRSVPHFVFPFFR